MLEDYLTADLVVCTSSQRRHDVGVGHVSLRIVLEVDVVSGLHVLYAHVHRRQHRAVEDLLGEVQVLLRVHVDSLICRPHEDVS